MGPILEEAPWGACMAFYAHAALAIRTLTISRTGPCLVDGLAGCRRGYCGLVVKSPDGCVRGMCSCECICK
eukprot:11457150-Alexandrium_andersonii.AAC.1